MAHYLSNNLQNIHINVCNSTTFLLKTHETKYSLVEFMLNFLESDYISIKITVL